jgi:hypothetical protein
MLSDDCHPHLAACAGPGVLELGGRTFVLPPASGPDLMGVHAEFRRQCLAQARDPLEVVNERIAAAEKAGRPFAPSVVDALVKTALASSGRAEGKAEPSDADVLARVHTLEGSHSLIWFRLRRADPAVTREWVAAAVPDMDARNEVFARLAEIDGLRALDPKKA